jgi:hypothetical protein
VTNTKHNPPEEEEEDQRDTWDVKINPAEPKTVATDAQIPGARIDAQGGGDVTGANRGVRALLKVGRAGEHLNKKRESSTLILVNSPKKGEATDVWTFRYKLF